MLRSRGNRAVAVAALTTAAAIFGSSSAQAADKWFDINGTTDGSGIVDNGPHTWNTTVTNWNTDPLGGAAGSVEAWVAGDNAFFSAGTDATIPFTVNVNGAQTAANMTVEEGRVIISGSAIGIGTGTVTIRPGATLQIPTISNVTLTAGAGGLVLDGGTLIQTNPSNAGSLWDADGPIRITANNGTVNYTSSGAGLVATYGGASAASAIIRDASVPVGTLVTLFKTGTHEVRYQGAGLPNTTYDKLVVSEGLFRLGFNSGVQDERGFGAVPASFMADQITLQNGGQLGNSFTLATLHQNRGITLGTGGGGLAGNFVIPGAISGVGSLTRISGGLTLGGVNTYTGGFIQNVAGTTTVNAGVSLAGAASNVTLTAGTVALNNTAQTIAGINGTGGTMALSAGHVLTINTSANHSFSGLISGATGAVVKDGGATQTLGAANTYGGGTTVNGGVLVAAHADAINTGQALTVNAGGTLRSQAGQLTALDVGTLTIDPAGRVDVNDGGIVKRNGGGAGSGTAGQTATQQATARLKTGLENGGNFDWLGPGISSTEAAADNATAGSVLFGVGVVQNNLAVAGSADGTTTDETAGNEIYMSFKGRTVALNDTLVRYTYMGDADLSGDITGTDYSLIDTGFALDLSGWVNGDFDYSGEVDPTDYALIDNAFAFQTGVLPDQLQAMYDLHVSMFGQAYIDALAAVQSGTIPEPGVMSLLGMVGVGLLARRRR